MGLSGRKTKQRIPNDPRNLCWADDAARFGSNYLAKFGWDGSTGLGVSGEGRTSHIKVSHKLDMLGIGAAQQKDPDGIAWKQNKDFECLLQRLNDASAAERNLESGKEEDEETNQANQKKRKHRENGEPKTERNKKRKAETKTDDEGQSSSNAESATIQPEKIEMTAVEVKKAVIVPRHRAHRARAINAKNMSSKSAAHISEILGIVPIPSGSSSGIDSSELSEQPRGKLTSLTDEVGIEKLTTSTKSVADYFKEKLNARSLNAIVSTSATQKDSDDSYDGPRMGLGSRARLENLTATGDVEQETQRIGLSTFSVSSLSLAFNKTLKDPDLEDPATIPKIDTNSNPQTKDLERQKKKRRKAKDEEMEKDGGANEGKDETKERKERKRKGKLDRGEKDRVEPHDSDNDLKELKRQEKRNRKAEKLQMSVTCPHTKTPVDETCVGKPQKRKKKDFRKSSRDEDTKLRVS